MLGIPGSEPFQEFLEARMRSVSGYMWTVYSDYIIRDGVIVPTDRAIKVASYIPAGRSELPGEFAKLAGESEENILEFVHRYGLLGYGYAPGTLLEIIGSMKAEIWTGFNQGDPVSWISFHATTVDIVMALTEALDSPGRLQWTIDMFKQTDSDGRVVVSYRYLSRGNPAPHLAELLILEDPEEIKRSNDPQDSSYRVGTRAVRNNPREIALTMIADILNDNLTGVSRQLQLEGGSGKAELELKSFFRPNNPLDAIYWMLADAVIAGRIRSCEECGAHFVADSDRRRFCPPVIGQKGISPCMNRNKVKRHRERMKT